MGAENERILNTTPEDPRSGNDGDIARLARGAGVTFIGRIAGRGLYALGQVILARLLGPANYGLYGIGWTTLRIVSRVTPIGLQHGVIHFGSKYWPRDRQTLAQIIIQSILISALFGLLAGVILFLIAPWLAVQVFNKPGLVSVFKIIAWTIPLGTGLRVAAAATRITQRTNESVLAEDISQSASSLAFFIIFYAIGWGLNGILWAVWLSFAFASGVALFFILTLFPEVRKIAITDIRVRKDLILFSLPTAATGIFSSLINQVDRFFAGFYLPAAQVGVYHAMSQSSFLFQIITGAFSAIMAPMIAGFYADREMERLEQIFRVSTKWGFYLGLPLFVLIFSVPSEIMRVVFGTQYTGDPLPLVILSAGQLASVATGPVAFILIMTGNQNVWMVVTGLLVLVEIALNILLVPTLGVVGSALATSTGLIGIFSLGLWQVRRRLGVWPYDRRFLKGIAAGVVSSILGLSAARIPIDADIVRVIVVGGVVVLSFLGIILLAGLDQEDHAFLRLSLNRLRRLLKFGGSDG